MRDIAVIGLGYVGLPVAVAFGSRQSVVAFDVNEERIAELKRGIDRNGEVTEEVLRTARLDLTADPSRIRACDFIIVAVPTPVDDANRPDLTSMIRAARLVGMNLKKGSIVVFESTVYPGATEEVCVPEIEKASGLKCREDFWVGYSPERINPGDREHTFERIVKVVAGQTPESAEVIRKVYASVVSAGVHLAPSIKVAEAAKVIENTQRDLNIALMNELSLIFHRLGIDTNDVLAAAGTKWNFLRFTPGLVGGHCIGVDPYYLTHKAEQLGYHPEVILAGRRINDSMGDVVADQTILHLIRRGKVVSHCRITILGVTFKENIPDLRNSGVLRIVNRLREYGVGIQLHDPYARSDEARAVYGEELQELEKLAPADAVILAVPHQSYVAAGWPLLSGLLVNRSGVVVDVKAVLPRDRCPDGINLWRL